MSRKITVECDLDQVLYDWIGYTTEHHAKGMTQEQLNKHPNRVGILAQMYRKEPDFFRNIPLCAGARSLIEGLRKLERAGIIALRFLTATDTIHPNPLKVREDKLFALYRDFGVHPSEVTVVLQSAQKADYVTQHSILLDDYEKNVADWEAVGGTAVLVPELYQAADVLYRLEQAIVKLRRGLPTVEGCRGLNSIEKLTDYGREVRKIRIELDLNLKEMAELMNVSSAYISALEHGHKEVTLGWCDRVKKELGLTNDQYLAITRSIAASRRSVTLNTAILPKEHAAVLVAFEEHYTKLPYSAWNTLTKLLEPH
jgi:HTH-type transcriptional regulator, competence development regulator